VVGQLKKAGAVSESNSTIELTAEVVASYLGNHQIPAADVPALIRTVHGAFSDKPEAVPAISEATKAQIRKSVTPGAIISFEDGRGYKMLRRHLAKYDLTPAAYRAKWGLPSDYPMVAPAYSSERSAHAVARGFGRKTAPPQPPAPAASPKKASKPRAAKATGADTPKPPAARPPRSKKSGA
jgi:predicted transcriptional regulator